jgi:hypothetical protein
MLVFKCIVVSIRKTNTLNEPHANQAVQSDGFASDTTVQERRMASDINR